MDRITIQDLVGKTMLKVEGDKFTVTFDTLDGEQYRMYHQSDCCESVHIDDVKGDLNDLVGAPILYVTEDISKENPPDCDPEILKWQDSFTWTNYEIATEKGKVNIRWYGESNGYYSESVDFARIN
jgi:hypothetical protein